MFTRRHPFLFFLIIMASLSTLCFLGLSLIIHSGTKMVNVQMTQKYSNSKGNIGIVEINGVILSSKKVIEDIHSFMDNEAIKAIILRIDSPGGGIAPSQEIYREIMKTREKKTIIASFGGVAASGGYYIGSAAHGIIANPGTLTGSIGVIMEYANLKEIVKKIGISPIVIKSGEFKDMGSPLRELKDKEKVIFQSLVDELHLQFVNDVAKARKINPDIMKKLADGRVYSGQKALKLKLIDRLGNLDDAVQWAGKMAKIEGELKPIYLKKDKMTLLRHLADSLLKDLNITSTVTDNFRYVIN
ncbi:MAG: signal peptide peptidase SppA [Desulfobacteraceae bacterium]|nr:signal peptide peptidase SppA [Desulfobacteraceae bacterium]